ncbi:hypothetical protein P7C70_g206, partial [Phenoliferia sp. Uapishka_3]
MLFGHHGTQVARQQGTPAAPMSFAATYNPPALSAQPQASSTISPTASVPVTVGYSSKPGSGPEAKYGVMRPTPSRMLEFGQFLQIEIGKTNTHISTHGQPQAEYLESEIEARWANNDMIPVSDKRRPIGDVWDAYLRDPSCKERYFRDRGQAQRKGNVSYSMNIMIVIDEERSSSDAPRRRAPKPVLHLTQAIEGFLIPINLDLADWENYGSGNTIKAHRRLHPLEANPSGPKMVFVGTVPEIGDVVFKMFKTARFDGVLRDVQPEENRDFIWDDARRHAKLQEDYSLFSQRCSESGLNPSILKIQPVSYIFAEHGEPEIEYNNNNVEVGRRYPPYTFWLVEGKLLTSSRKFSGTVGQFVQPSDPWIKLLEAFVHWSYLKHNKTWFCVDLQGAEDEGQYGQKIFVLYDAQSHTIEATSGIGDGGEDALNKAWSFHKCGELCKSLQLAEIVE